MSPANPFFQPFRFIATDVVDVPLGPAFLRQLGSHPGTHVPSGIVCAAGGVMLFMMVVTCWLAWVLRNKVCLRHLGSANGAFTRAGNGQDAKKPTICDALGASIIFERTFRAAMPWTAITSIASPEAEKATASKSEEVLSQTTLNQGDRTAPLPPVKLDIPWPQFPLAETFAEDIAITSTPQAKFYSARSGCDVHGHCVRPRWSDWLGTRTMDSVSANLLSQDETVASHETLKISPVFALSEINATHTPKQGLGRQTRAELAKLPERYAHIGTNSKTRRVLSSADERRQRHWHAFLLPKCSICYLRAVKIQLAREASRITLLKLCSCDWAEWSVEDILPVQATCGGYITLRKALRVARPASPIPRGVLGIAGRAMEPRRRPPVLIVENLMLKALLLHLTSEGLPASGLLGFSGVLRLDETIFRSLFGACYVSREDGAISFVSTTGRAGQFSDNSHVEVNVSRDKEPLEQSSPAFIREPDAQLDRDTIDGELQADDINFYFSPADGPVLNKLLRKHGILAWKVLHMNMFPWGAAFTLRLMLHNPAMWWSGFKQEYIAGIAAVAPNDPTAHRVLWLRDHAVGVRLDCWEVWTQYVVRNPRSPFVLDVWEEQREECRRKMEEDMARRFR